jgi:hypothetical protein
MVNFTVFHLLPDRMSKRGLDSGEEGSAEECTLGGQSCSGSLLMYKDGVLEWIVFNRPGVAGAVLQTALSLSHSLSDGL